MPQLSENIQEAQMRTREWLRTGAGTAGFFVAASTRAFAGTGGSEDEGIILGAIVVLSFSLAAALYAYRRWHARMHVPTPSFNEDALNGMHALDDHGDGRMDEEGDDTRDTRE